MLAVHSEFPEVGKASKFIASVNLLLHLRIYFDRQRMIMSAAASKTQMRAMANVMPLVLLLLASPATAFVASPTTTTSSTQHTSRAHSTTARFIFNRSSSSSSSPSTQPPSKKQSAAKGSRPPFFSTSYASIFQKSNDDEESSSPSKANTVVLEKEPTFSMPDLSEFLRPSTSSSDAATTVVTKRAPPAKASGSSSSSSSINQQDEQQQQLALEPQTVALGFAGALVTALIGACYAFGWSIDDVTQTAQTFFSNPQASLQQLLDYVESAGSAGPLYFGVAYFLAEILAIPATPLTMSAGFLFGVGPGTITVLIAATFAASFGFVVGKTVLRGTVEKILEDNPKFAKLDKAVGEEGFPLLLLVRLTPLFPFSLSNYVYGASSIKFPDYFFGTLLGFAPGTLAYVYTGQVGQTLFTGEGSQPWYVYVGGLAVLTGFLKLVTDAATKIVSALDEDEEDYQ